MLIRGQKRVVIVGVVAIPAAWIIYLLRSASRTPATSVSSYSTASTDSYTKPTALHQPPPPNDVASTKPPSPRDSGQGIFTSFNPTAYHTYLRGLSDAQLRQKEKSKMCAEVSGTTSLVGNVGTAILTGGVLSPFVLLSARKMYLTESKLPLIREELTRRGMSHSVLTSRLMAKGVGKSAMTMFVGDALTN